MNCGGPRPCLENKWSLHRLGDRHYPPSSNFGKLNGEEPYPFAKGWVPSGMGFDCSTFRQNDMGSGSGRHHVSAVNRRKPGSIPWATHHASIAQRTVQPSSKGTIWVQVLVDAPLLPCLPAPTGVQSRHEHFTAPMASTPTPATGSEWACAYVGRIRTRFNQHHPPEYGGFFNA